MLQKFFKKSFFFKLNYFYNFYFFYFYKYINFLPSTFKFKFHFNSFLKKGLLKIIFFWKISFLFLKLIYFLIKHPVISPKTRHLTYPINLSIPKSHSHIRKLIKFSFFKSKIKTLKKFIYSRRIKTKKQFFFFQKFPKKFFSFWKRSLLWIVNEVTQKYFLVLITSMGSYEINPLTYGIKYTNFFYSLYWYFLFEQEKPLCLGGYFFFFWRKFFFP